MMAPATMSAAMTDQKTTLRLVSDICFSSTAIMGKWNAKALTSLNCDRRGRLIPVKEPPALPGHNQQMISLEDCIAMCGLTEAEISAIAEHEHVPAIAAATLGQYLMHRPHGVDRIRQMIVEDIRAALGAGNKAHAALLMSALR